MEKKTIIRLFAAIRFNRLTLLTKLLLSLIFLFYIGVAFSQTGIKGTVKDSKGKPLPYSTIYVKELKTGTVANEQGYFEFPVPRGNYLVDFRCLGYQSVTRQASVQQAYVSLDVRLNEQLIELKTVSIYATDENPAYPIMRKAVAAAHYYRILVKAYDADIYIKGSGEVRIPKIVIKFDKEEGFDSVEYFTNESFNHIRFEYPAKYEQKVISARNNNNDSTMGMVDRYTNASIYEPDFGGTVSPLSPSAFSFYRFKLINTFTDKGAQIYKISVTPRSKGSNYFKGDIYIVDKLWCVYNFNLTTLWEGFEIAISQMFAPVSEKIWIPINQQYNMKGSFVGIRIKWLYLASMSNYVLEINDSLKFSNLTLIDEKTERDYAKALEAESKLKKQKPESTSDSAALKKKESEFTVSDFKKLMKEYEKEEMKKAEEPDVVSDYSTVVDSMAYKKNNQYWDSIRPIPLSETEKKLGHDLKKDSILAQKKRVKTDTTSKAGSVISDVFFGNTFNLGKSLTLRYYSPLLCINFNTVEGYNLNVPVGLEYKKNKQTVVKFEPVIRYGFTSDAFSPSAGLQYNYKRDRYRKGYIKLQGGRIISQYNPENPILPLFNSLSTLIWRYNYMKIYQSDMGTVTFSTYLNDKLNLKATAGWAERTELFNQTNDSWAETDLREYTPNAPENIEDTNTTFPVHQAFTASFKIVYHPIVKYRKTNGVKEPIPNSFPVLTLDYQGGFKNILGSDVDFHRIEAGFQHQLGEYRLKLDFRLFGGITFSKGQTYFMDYSHLNGNKIPLDYTNPMNTYQLLDYYKYSTNGAYVGMHARLSLKKFIITQIGWINLIGIHEGLTVNYLKTEYSPHYYELGYGIENIVRLFKMEVFTNFENDHYTGYGIRIGISLGGAVSIEREE